MELKQFIFDLMDRSYRVKRQQMIWARDYESAERKINDMIKDMDGIVSVQLVF